MGERKRSHAGGILGLCELIAEHAEAIEYDLISLGLRLRDVGSDHFSWRDLSVIVRQAPSGSAIARAVAPEDSAWGLQEHLLALIADASRMLVWAKSEDCAKGRTSTMPKPLPRPGIEDESTVTVNRFGHEEDVHDLQTMREFLGW